MSRLFASVFSARHFFGLGVGVPLVLGLVAHAPAYAQDAEPEAEPAPSPVEPGSAPGGPDRVRPLGGNLPMPMGGPGGPGGFERPPGEGGEKQGQSISPRGGGDGPDSGPAAVSTQRAPCVESKGKITMDYIDAPVADVVKYMAEITCKNFIIKDDLSGKITIISHQQVSVSEAYEAFLSALEVVGYTTVAVGKNTKVVPTTEAANSPLKIYQTDDDLPSTDNFVTQIIQLENVPVSEMASVVKELAGAKVRVVAYAPTNTLIVTDSAFNIRRVYKIISQLDVAAPKSKLVVMRFKYAAAADVEKILEEVYGVAASSSSSSSNTSTRETANSRRQKKGETGAAATPGSTSMSVGTEGVFISKIISDERTNSVILMANEAALADVQALVAKLDVDIDPSSRSQIHVVYLANAKAADVAGILRDLSYSSNSGSRSGSSTSSGNRSSSGRSTGSSNSSRSGSSGSSRGNYGSSGGGFGGSSSSGSSRGGFGGGMPGGAPGDPPAFGTTPAGSTGVVAAFDNGMRVTADVNTNSLVVIAAPEDFRVLKQVIDKLDIMRRQVFVEAVVLEVGSEDEFDFGIGYHMGAIDGSGTTSFGSSQLNGSSVGLSLSDALSGLAMGVFGQNIDIPYTDSSGASSTIPIPAFGIAINALASNSGVDILSNPSLLIIDNEEAKINVGRNVPFPVSSGRDSNNNPIVSYQRQNVGIELKVTPQINETNFVTMQITLTVAEVEEDSSGLDVSTAGFITSERGTENVVVVQDNQTIVIGGLIGNTQTNVETKVPILGDIPLIGALFRGNRNTERKTNLLIFMTPHVINEPADLEEVYRVKWLQRQEFIRRFYGKSRDKQQEEMGKILAGSLNMIDQPSQYRAKALPVPREQVIGSGSSTTILDPAGQTGGATPDAATSPATSPTPTTASPAVPATIIMPVTPVPSTEPAAPVEPKPTPAPGAN